MQYPYILRSFLYSELSQLPLIQFRPYKFIHSPYRRVLRTNAGRAILRELFYSTSFPYRLCEKDLSTQLNFVSYDIFHQRLTWRLDPSSRLTLNSPRCEELQWEMRQKWRRRQLNFAIESLQIPNTIISARVAAVIRPQHDEGRLPCCCSWCFFNWVVTVIRRTFNTNVN